MKKMLVVCALAFLGCKNKAVKATEDMADEVCACKDPQCALEAAKKGQEKLKGMMDEKGTQADLDEAQVAIKRMQQCITDLAKKK
jgi:hypothetical protein